MNKLVKWGLIAVVVFVAYHIWQGKQAAGGHGKIGGKMAAGY